MEVKLKNVDFVKETKKSRQTINSFIEEQINNKIKDLIPKAVLDSTTKLVLTNAIYFKGTWKWEFNPKYTGEVDFKITPTNVIKVLMMCMKPEKAKFNYADAVDLQILEVPYEEDKIFMLILLPNDNLENIEPITSEKLQKRESQMEETTLDEVYLPKFEFDTKYFMKDTLSEMCMPTLLEQVRIFLIWMKRTRFMLKKQSIRRLLRLTSRALMQQPQLELLLT